MGSELRPSRWSSIWKFFWKVNFAVLLGLFAIGFLLDFINKHRALQNITPLPPVSAYISTPENEKVLQLFVRDVVTFTLLHESGHLIFTTYNLPLGSQDTNESAADSFAATVMMSQIGKGSGPQYNGLVSAALFWDALNTLEQTGAPGQYDWADFHEQPEQRASKLACILYGANPKAFAAIAQKFKLEDREKECVANAANTREDWSRIISLNLNSNAGKLLDPWSPHVAVLYRQVPVGLPDGLTATLSRDRQEARALGTLDFIGHNLLLLKTPPNQDVEAEQRILDAKRNLTMKQDPLSIPLENLSPFPHVDHPSEDDSLSAYNYTVVGDSCLDSSNRPEQNAFWEPKTQSVVLCYAWVGLVEDLGKRLLAGSH